MIRWGQRNAIGGRVEEMRSRKPRIRTNHVIYSPVTCKKITAVTQKHRLFTPFFFFPTA
jgi:hypothetical protein